NAIGTATTNASPRALTTTFDIVQMLPGPGLDGRHLAGRGLEAQAEAALRGLVRQRVPGRIVLVWLDLEGAAVERLHLASPAADVRATERPQPRLATQLDAHHATVDDHQVEIRPFTLVTQVPALAGRRAAFLAGPVRELQHLVHRHAGAHGTERAQAEAPGGG